MEISLSIISKGYFINRTLIYLILIYFICMILRYFNSSYYCFCIFLILVPYDKIKLCSEKSIPK